MLSAVVGATETPLLKLPMLAVLAICLAWLAAAACAQDPAVESFRDPRSGRVIFMKNPQPQAVEAALSRVTPRTTPVTRPEEVQTGTDPVLLSDAFLELHGRAYGLENPVGELVPVQVKRDRFGNRHVYYHQVHQGVPVFGSEILVHLGAGSAVRSSNGRIVPGLSVSPKAAVTKEEAIATAKASFLAEHGIADPEVMLARLYVLNLGLIKTGRTRSPGWCTRCRCTSWSRWSAS